jgi:hypothetical protein
MLEAPTKKDWMGVGFECLKRNGEVVDMAIGVQRKQETGIEWNMIPHFESDGLSALKRVLAAHGYDAGELPRTKSGRPSWAGALRAIWEYAGHLGDYQFPWKRFDTSLSGKSPGIAWLVLTAEQTRSVQAASRSAGVSLNSTLLSTLHQSVLSDLAGPFESGRWLVPFNLRGALSGYAEHSNQASYLTVDLSPSAGPREVDELVNQLIARHYPWGSWYWLQLGRFVGAERIRKMQAKSLSSGKSWVGSFSNLGSWNPPAGQGDSIDALVCCPPVFRVLPVGAASITWKGRLGLGLQLHPGLEKTLGETEALLGRWVEAVLRAAAAAG